MSPRNRAALFSFCLLCSTVSPACAEGTVSFEHDMLPMIHARPEFEKFLLGTLKIADAGSGTRISDTAIPALGGARMGPYTFDAVWHASDGDVAVTLVIATSTKFLDKGGREIKGGRLMRATSLQETFSSIEIEPAR